MEGCSKNSLISASLHNLALPQPDSSSEHRSLLCPYSHQIGMSSRPWNSCSGVLTIFKYCHLNLFCKVGQSSSNGASDSYHNLASPIKVKQKHLTLSPSVKLCASIQSLVLRRWDSASSSGCT